MYLKHLAIMMDGNGRWAKKQGYKRAAGHIEGEKTFRKICKVASIKGVKYLTVFAFSTENWNRPESEVKGIMKILTHFFLTSELMAKENNFKITAIGNREGLSSELRNAIEYIESATNFNNGMHIQIAVNYGGLDDIVRAVNKCIKLHGNSIITAQNIADSLDTKNVPPPDLMIRTGGEVRLSNFLIWQLAYTELYFTDVLWPDFDENELDKALLEYSNRNRRFGRL